MICTSWSWPNLFDVSRNQVNLYEDAKSITNRVKLLMLTELTELYMNPTFGVGLKQYLFTYNNDNTIALIRDNLIEQLRLWEPSVVPDDTQIVRGLTYTGGSSELTTVSDKMMKLELTVTLKTIKQQDISFDMTITEDMLV